MTIRRPGPVGRGGRIRWTGWRPMGCGAVGWAMVVLAGAAGDRAIASTGAEFLRFIPSARAVGMGETAAASGSGADALSGNPAGLLAGPGSAVALTHGTEIGGQRQEAAAFVTGTDRTAGGAQLVFSSMSFDAVDGLGDPVTVGAQDLVASIAGARAVGGVFRVGVTGRWWTSALLDRRATGWSADGGIRAVWGERFAAGLVLTHLGTAESFGAGSAPLPGAVRTGVASRTVIAGIGVAGTLEWAAPFRSGDAGGAHAGVEAAWRRFALRCGYAGSRAMGRWSAGGTAGAGPLTIHYAFARREVFGPAHRLSAEWYWGGADPGR